MTTKLDDHPIICVHIGENKYQLGQGVTAITVCYVNGEMAEVPWAEIWDEERLLARIRMGAVEGLRYRCP